MNETLFQGIKYQTRQSIKVPNNLNGSESASTEIRSSFLNIL